jgi:hypothetical protein
MPRFYFHVEDGERVEDYAGRDVEGGIEAIQAIAELEAREIISEAAKMGVDATDWWFEIVNEHGYTVLIYRFQHAVPLIRLKAASVETPFKPARH